MEQRDREPPDDGRWGREDHREWQKFLFEYYKHLATVSGAGALVVLAIYRERVLDQQPLRFALGCFAVAAVLSIGGMQVSLFSFAKPPTGRRPQPPIVAFAAAGLAGGAVVAVLVTALNVPTWVLVLYTTAVFVVGSVLIAWSGYSRRKRGS